MRSLPVLGTEGKTTRMANSDWNRPSVGTLLSISLRQTASKRERFPDRNSCFPRASPVKFAIRRKKIAAASRAVALRFTVLDFGPPELNGPRHAIHRPEPLARRTGLFRPEQSGLPFEEFLEGAFGYRTRRALGNLLHVVRLEIRSAPASSWTRRQNFPQPSVNGPVPLESKRGRTMACSDPPWTSADKQLGKSG